MIGMIHVVAEVRPHGEAQVMAFRKLVHYNGLAIENEDDLKAFWKEAEDEIEKVNKRYPKSAGFVLTHRREEVEDFGRVFSPYSDIPVVTVFVLFSSGVFKKKEVRNG